MSKNTDVSKVALPLAVGLTKAAAMLDVSYKTVWRMVRDGQLYAKRVRGIWRVPVPEIQAYLNRLGNNLEGGVANEQA